MIKYSITALLLQLISCWAISQNNYQEISLPELMKNIMHGEKDYLILDVRTKGEYHDSLTSGKHLNIGRIKGAINIPLQDLQRDSNALKTLDAHKDKNIYVICSHSYRSRTISNLLLRNGFTKITNVQGGMSEWYRDFDGLKPFAPVMLEKNIPYPNISPAELFEKMKKKEEIVFIGFKNAPRGFFDTIITKLYNYFPDFKNTIYFRAVDSAAVLNKARELQGKTIVTFNTIGMGGGEMAAWLTQNHIPHVNYLVGNLAGFFEYMANYQDAEKKEKYFTVKSGIEFYSGLSLCRALEKNKAIRLVDLRHDTLFAKTTTGTKISYKKLKGAVNFPFYKTAEEFASQFPDKSKEYVLLGQQNYVGIELANELVKKGYKVGWLIGGNERWEWYTNNIPAFSCKDYFEK